VNLFFLDHPQLSGIFNVGTGKAETFNQVAHATVNSIRRARKEAELSIEELRDQGMLEYIPFPSQLVGKYQSFTQADVSALRAAGYQVPFLGVNEGVSRYVDARLRAGEGA
jgi:ADP-L-glycero-D-manno-heptose 6-epimerase